MAEPHGVRIRSYQVGFGDCFLLTFQYATEDRHILIDFGSTGKPENPEKLNGTLKNHMQRVADHITQTCNGKLEAVVATHRHMDHISGFDTEKGPGETIRDLQPEVVVQPWTEHPDAETQATSLDGLSAREIAFALGLRRMDAIARSAVNIFQTLRQDPGLRSAVNAGLVEELGFLGETNLKNLSAVKNLQDMGSKAAHYVSYGNDSGINLPGVTVSVLGPPTLDQFEDIRKQRSEDEEEFWMLHAVQQLGALESYENAPYERSLFENFVLDNHEPSTAWLREQLERASIIERLEVVRRLDSALNNTSVILLFKVGNQKLLFPGDAQIENWEWAIKRSPEAEDNLNLLRDVTVYKCGHHGSRNATPMTLWENFSNRKTISDPNRLRALLSTAEGKHGHADDNTEVPRETLVAALEQQTMLHTIETVDPNSQDPYIEIDLPVG